MHTHTHNDVIIKKHRRTHKEFRVSTAGSHRLDIHVISPSSVGSVPVRSASLYTDLPSPPHPHPNVNDDCICVAPAVIRRSLLREAVVVRTPSREGQGDAQRSTAGIRARGGQAELESWVLLHRPAAHVARRVAYKQQHQPEPPHCGARTEDGLERQREVSLCPHNPRRLQLVPTHARQRITTRQKPSARAR